MEIFVVRNNDDDGYEVYGVFDSLDKAHEMVDNIYEENPYAIEKWELNSFKNECVLIEEGWGKRKWAFYNKKLEKWC